MTTLLTPCVQYYQEFSCGHKYLSKFVKCHAHRGNSVIFCDSYLTEYVAELKSPKKCDQCKENSKEPAEDPS